MPRTATARGTTGGTENARRRARTAPSTATAPRQRPRIPEWAWPALAVVVAFVVRVMAWRHQPFITVDGTQFVRFAEAIRAGASAAAFGGISFSAPGYPLLVAPVLSLVHDRVAAPALVSFVCGTLLPWPVWTLARVRLSPALAGLPALAVAIHPELARYSSVVMSESAYLLALYGSLALVARSSLGAGALMGAAYAIRPEAIVAAVMLAARGVWRVAKRRTTSRQALVGAAGFLAIAVPCVLWYHATIGAWTVSPKLANVGASASDWRSIESTIAGPQSPTPAPTFRRRLVEAGHNVRAGAGPYARWLLELWPAPLLLLSIVGATAGAGIVAVAFSQLLAMVAFSFAVSRYLLPMLPALALLAAYSTLRLRRGWAIAAAVLAVAGLAMAWARGAPAFLAPYDGHIEAHVDAGEWLGRNSSPGEAVMDRKPYIAFYARRPYVVMPDATYDSLVTWAVRTRSRWLVVDQGEAAIFRRTLEPLLYDSAFRDRESRLELAYVGGRQIGYGVGLFRVLQPGETRSGRPPAIEAKWLTRP